MQLCRFALFLCMAVLIGSSLPTEAREPDMEVSLKPARRKPASVDPARPFKGKASGAKSLKADSGRKYKNLRMSPRRVTPILDIDISVKDELDFEADGR